MQETPIMELLGLFKAHDEKNVMSANERLFGHQRRRAGLKSSLVAALLAGCVVNAPFVVAEEEVVSDTAMAFTQALGKLSDVHVAAPLIAVLKKTGAWAWALSGLGDLRLTKHPALRDYYDGVHKSVAAARSKLGDVLAAALLISTLRDKGSMPARRWDAAEALGKLGDVRAVAPLIAALQDKDENI